MSNFIDRFVTILIFDFAFSLAIWLADSFVCHCAPFGSLPSPLLTSHHLPCNLLNHKRMYVDAHHGSGIKPMYVDAHRSVTLPTSFSTSHLLPCCNYLNYKLHIAMEKTESRSVHYYLNYYLGRVADCLTRRVTTCSILQTDKATLVLEATNRIVSLEAQVKEMLEELKRTRRSRNSSLATATATATAPVAPLPNLVRPQSYFTANVRLHVSGLGQVWITIHSPEEARHLRHRLLELVTTVIASRSHLDIVHLNVSRVGFTRFYTLHCQV